MEFPFEILRNILSHVSDYQTVAALKSIPELKGIAEDNCYSRVSSLAFSVQPENSDEDGNIVTSKVVTNGKDSMELSKDKALMLFLEIQNKSKQLRSLKIEGVKKHNPDVSDEARFTFDDQIMETFRAIPVSYLKESLSVKDLAVSFFWYNNDTPSTWLLSVMQKCPQIEFLELDNNFWLLMQHDDVQNFRLVFEGPNASHLKRVKLTCHPIYELFVDFEHSTVNFSWDKDNIRSFLSLRQRITAFGSIKYARVRGTNIKRTVHLIQWKNQFLELTETMENVNVELLVVILPPQGPADLVETLLKSRDPKRMFEWMGGFLGRARGLDFKENKLTIELTISLRKGTENELEGLVDAYNGGMQHPFSGEEFPYEYDTLTLAHPITVEMVKEGQWIEDLWVVRKGNKVAVLNLQFKFFKIST